MRWSARQSSRRTCWRSSTAHDGDLKDPATSKQLTSIGLDILPTTPEELAAYIKAEIPKWAAIIKASGATLE